MLRTCKDTWEAINFVLGFLIVEELDSLIPFLYTFLIETYDQKYSITNVDYMQIKMPRWIARMTLMRYLFSSFLCAIFTVDIL